MTMWVIHYTDKRVQKGDRVNMRELKGQVTIFISMVMMCIFALFCGLLESARTAGSRWYLQTIVSSSLDSVFSQYHRQLWDSYRLLFAEYETEEEMEADFAGFLQPYLDESGWYPAELEEVTVEEWLKATDDYGIYLEKEILDYMKYGIWEMDFKIDDINGLWENTKEAGAVKEIAETYREHAKDALKLEKALEAISESQKKQMEKKQKCLSCLKNYNGFGFQRAAKELIRELKRMPGLVKEYEKQADRLTKKLGESRKVFNDEKENCTSPVNDQLEREVEQFESYISQDGQRRKEIEELETKSYEQIQHIEDVMEEAEEVERIIDEWEDDEDDDGPDLRALWSPVIYHFEQLKIYPISFSHGVKDKKTEGWLKQIQKMCQSGLLNLVIPDGVNVSDGMMETKELPSESGNMTPKAREISLTDHWIVNEYCGKFFRSFPTNGLEESQSGEITFEPGVKGDDGLSYELEYMIGGKKLDEENLTSVVSRLLVIREGLNMIHILSDSKKRQEAQNLAFLITGVAGLTPLVFLTTFFIMSIWALGESLMDVRGLLAGKKVVIWKSAKNWTLTLDSLVTMGREGQIGTGGGDEGFSYVSWLKLLLLMDEIVSQEYRMMDLIQMNICRKQSSFRMRRGTYQIRLKNHLIGKHVFFSLGLMERQTGNKDHTYPIEVVGERKY